MVRFRACIDVPDLERAIAFYRDAPGLTVARRFGDGAAEPAGATIPVDALAKPPFGHGFCLVEPRGRGYDAPRPDGGGAP